MERKSQTDNGKQAVKQKFVLYFVAVPAQLRREPLCSDVPQMSLKQT